MNQEMSKVIRNTIVPELMDQKVKCIDLEGKTYMELSNPLCFL